MKHNKSNKVMAVTLLASSLVMAGSVMAAGGAGVSRLVGAGSGGSASGSQARYSIRRKVHGAGAVKRASTTAA